MDTVERTPAAVVHPDDVATMYRNLVAAVSAHNATAKDTPDAVLSQSLDDINQTSERISITDSTSADDLIAKLELFKGNLEAREGYQIPDRDAPALLAGLQRDVRRLVGTSAGKECPASNDAGKMQDPVSRLISDMESETNSIGEATTALYGIFEEGSTKGSRFDSHTLAHFFCALNTLNPALGRLEKLWANAWEQKCGSRS